MNSAISEARTGWAEAARDFAWSHPEWWTAGLGGAAWCAVLWHGWRHAGHRMGFATEWTHWVLMVTAMMFPLLREPVEAAASGSLWGRRNRAIGLFLLGYLGIWAALGGMVAWMRAFRWAGGDAAAAGGFLVAALWLLTPWHRRGMMGCHRRVPLAPMGWKADWDCLRFGGLIGGACVRSCFPVMFACALAGHGVLAMGAGAAAAIFERCYFRPKLREAGAVLIAAALIYVAMAFR
ncbi:MAG TPA: DUF2182 domain-containing protein [Bryobacteraceae bacterium]|nr:DUF2182 domain-containing protein [Bryobacteraceae bacterium]